MPLPAPDPSRCSRRELLLVPAALALLVALFLARPIASFRSAHYSTADLLNELPLTRTDPTHWVRDRLTSDPVLQMLPWTSFARAELAQGRAPLWNPYNACGLPLLGNHQSAVFSPFTLPFYVAPMKFALLAAAFAKLWLAGLFTYLFLRKLRSAPSSAFAGAVAFTFCGHQSLLVHWPHSGVAVWLPASLWCIETILSELEEPRGRATLRWHFALAAVLALQVYSGHPETLGVSLALLALWTAARLIGMRASVGTGRSLRAGAALIACGVLAAGFAAPQLCPFVEYLTHSHTLQTRARAEIMPLDALSWPRHFFPNFLGTNLSGKVLAEDLPAPNYHVATVGYAGALVLVLAALAVPRALRDGRWLAFALVAVVWPVWSHDVLGLGRMLSRGWLEALPTYVAQLPWQFSVACLTARGLDELRRVEGRPRVRALVFAALSLTALAVFGIFAVRMSSDVIAAVHVMAITADAIRSHLWLVSVSFVAGVGAAAALAFVRSPRVADVLSIGVASCIVLQTGGVFGPYQSVTKDEMFYPRAEGVRAVQELCGRARMAILGTKGMPPQANLVYGLDELPSCDALRIAEVAQLYVRLFHPYDDFFFARRADARSLKLFGAEFLLYQREPDARFAWKYEGALEELEHTATLPGFDLYRVPDSRGRAWLVGRATIAATGEEALAAVSGKSFDPYASVVLGPDAPQDAARSSEGASGNVRMLEELPCRVRLRVEHDAPAYLVVAQARYPGWSARIDGEERPLLRANYAFQALDVPADSHEVELVYEPASWRLGLLAALVSVVVSISFALFTRLRARGASLASPIAPQ